MSRMLATAAALALLPQCSQPAEPEVEARGAAAEQADPFATGNPYPIGHAKHSCDSYAVWWQGGGYPNGFVAYETPHRLSTWGTLERWVADMYRGASTARALALHQRYDDLVSQMPMTTDAADTRRLQGLEDQVFALARDILASEAAITPPGKKAPIVESALGLVPGYAYGMLVRDGDYARFTRRIARARAEGLLPDFFANDAKEITASAPELGCCTQGAGRAAVMSHLLAGRVELAELVLRLTAAGTVLHSDPSFHAPYDRARLRAEVLGPNGRYDALLDVAAGWDKPFCSKIVHDYVEWLDLGSRAAAVRKDRSMAAHFRKRIRFLQNKAPDQAIVPFFDHILESADQRLSFAEVR